MTLCSSITVPAAAEEYQAHVGFLLLITKMKSTCHHCYQGHRHSEHKSRQVPPQSTHLKHECGFLCDFCVCTGRVGASAYFSSAFCVNSCHRSRFYNMCRRAGPDYDAGLCLCEVSAHTCEYSNCDLQLPPSRLRIKIDMLFFKIPSALRPIF